MSNIFKLTKNLTIDLQKIISGKILFYANSGGGKSWGIRFLLELFAGHIPQIILDTEGEFATLREKYDHILIGKGHDIAANPKTAALLALRLWEERVSAVIDLFELDERDRREFVKNFVNAMINAPKHLWKPVMLVIDEAHEYAPENGSSEASLALHRLASKGRKRMIGAVFATTRLSLLSKNLVASCKNKFIGQSSLEADMKRAGFELGLTSRDQLISLRDLDPGEFFVFGPAITKAVEKMKFGPVKTSHGDAAYVATKVMPVSDKVRNALARLADLPKEAAEEANTIEALKSEIRTLKAHKCPPQTGTPKEVIDKLVNAQVTAAVLKHGKEWEKIVKKWKDFAESVYKTLRNDVGILNRDLEDLLKREPKETLPPFTMTPSNIVSLPKDFKIASLSKIPVGDNPIPVNVYDVAAAAALKNRFKAQYAPDAEDSLAGGEKKVLIAIAQHDEGITREHLTIVTGYKKSTRNRYLQFLAAKGLIREAGDYINVNDAGREALGDDYKPLPTGSELRDHLIRTLPEGERKILEVLIGSYPDAVPREEISDKTGYQKSTRNRYIQYLAARHLVVRAGDHLKAADKLFD